MLIEINDWKTGVKIVKLYYMLADRMERKESVTDVLLKFETMGIEIMNINPTDSNKKLKPTNLRKIADEFRKLMEITEEEVDDMEV
jgi:hypothetical protein